MVKALFLTVVLFLSLASAAECIQLLSGSESLEEQGYAGQARLGEMYKNAGECFHEAGDERRSLDHYKLSGDYYLMAAENFDSAGDYEKQMIWYISSGDSYMNAGRNDLARESFEAAKLFYETHSSHLQPSLYAQANKKIYDSENPMPVSYTNTEAQETYTDYAAIGIAAIVILGIALTVYYFGK